MRALHTFLVFVNRKPHHTIRSSTSFQALNEALKGHPASDRVEVKKIVDITLGLEPETFEVLVQRCGGSLESWTVPNRMIAAPCTR